MAESYPVEPDLRKWGSNALRYLVEVELRGHGGYNGFNPCGLCGLKDAARLILEERGDA